MPSRLDVKFNRVDTRLTILYGVEYWPVRNSQVKKINVAKIRMLKWMYGYTGRDKIITKICGTRWE